MCNSTATVDIYYPSDGIARPGVLAKQVRFGGPSRPVGWVCDFALPARTTSVNADWGEGWPMILYLSNDSSALPLSVRRFSSIRSYGDLVGNLVGTLGKRTKCIYTWAQLLCSWLIHPKDLVYGVRPKACVLVCVLSGCEQLYFDTC